MSGQAWLRTEARAALPPGTGITGIDPSVQGEVLGIDVDAFTAAAEDTKVNCPVSQALGDH